MGIHFHHLERVPKSGGKSGLNFALALARNMVLECGGISYSSSSGFSHLHHTLDLVPDSV